MTAMVMVLNEEAGDRHFGYSTEEELCLIAAHIVRERYKAGLYDDTPLPLLLNMALNESNKAALVFLGSRSAYPHEGFKLFTEEELKERSEIVTVSNDVA